MLFSIDQSRLSKALKILQGIIQTRSAISVLSNILISTTEEGNIQITASDTSITIITICSGIIKHQGKCCISGSKLLKIIRLLPTDAIIEFKKLKNNWVELKSNKTIYKLAGTSVDLFPATPNLNLSEKRTIPLELLQNFINKTSFATAKEGFQNLFPGAKFLIENYIIKMITTDGHRLALIERELDESEKEIENVDTLIPLTTLKQIKKLSGKYLYYNETEHYHFFYDRKTMIISRKVSGRFPDYEKVIPYDCSYILKCNAKDLLNTINRISLVSDESNNSVSLLFKNNQITVSAKNKEIGDAREIIKAQYNQDNIGVAIVMEQNVTIFA